MDKSRFSDHGVNAKLIGDCGRTMSIRDSRIRIVAKIVHTERAPPAETELSRELSVYVYCAHYMTILQA